MLKIKKKNQTNRYINCKNRYKVKGSIIKLFEVQLVEIILSQFVQTVPKDCIVPILLSLILVKL